ncbi:MAG: D-aminoacyl-tRNA deacylase [Lachnospiraceae bacterium]
MRFLVQEVTKAGVMAEGRLTGTIGEGLLVFIGVGREDTEQIADRMTDKLLGLRIFRDDAGKTNRSLADVGGELMLVSQFTLYADCRHGHRPGFTDAAEPALAEHLYNYIVSRCRQKVPVVRTGVFGAHMEVSLVNDGPFTIWLDSDSLLKRRKQGET